MKLAIALALLSAALSSAASPLSALLDEAGRNNPEILAARQAWKASTQIPTQVSTLPDPQVTVQHLSVGSPRPFAGFTNSDFAYIGLGVSQDVPYPGKLKLKAEAARSEAAVARQHLEAVTRSILQQVKDAYFQLAYIHESLTVLDRNNKLLEQLEKIADARYRVGQGNQQDVLKTQLERTKLQRDLVHHHNLVETQQARLRKLLNRPSDSPEIEPESIVETPLSLSVDDLLDHVRAENPDVAARQETVNRQGLQIEMARKDRYPDFSVQYMWQHTAEPFRDYYQLTFSARLPVYRARKLNPEMNQAVEQLNQSRREYEAQVQSDFFELRSQYLAAQTDAQTLKIYREGLIPQALATYQSGLAAYQSGRQDFETLLTTFMDVLNFDEEYWKTLSEHETALSKIEQITGLTLR